MNLRLQSWMAVVVAYQSCTRKYSQMLEEFGLTAPQFDVLLAVDALQAQATPKHIAQRLLVTKGNITGVLSRLEAAGLIERRPHAQDGRSMVCSLSATGQHTLDLARRAAAAFIEQQLAPFDDEAVNRIGQDMRRMTQHLRALDPVAIAQQVSSAAERGA